MQAENLFEAKPVLEELRELGLSRATIASESKISISTINNYFGGQKCGAVYYNALRALLEKTKKKKGA